MPAKPDRSAAAGADQRRQLILVQLNEICMDTVARYRGRLHLPAFEHMLDKGLVSTTAEKHYDDLEPWIQWFSVYTGQTAAEHGLFRLGDAVGHPSKQIFEHLEEHGVCIGAVAAFNAENRLHEPAYFVPDPWTHTPSDGSWWSRTVGQAIHQMVNDNAQRRATVRSLASLLAGVLRFARPRHYLRYLRLAATSRTAPWRRALFLDLLLHDMHMRLFARGQADFSTLFLNAGAHIQHHYFHNAKALPAGGPSNPPEYISASEDPVAEMLMLYDVLLGEYLGLASTPQQPGPELIVATGLAQQPYPRTSYYWRLRNHFDFLQRLGLRNFVVKPRMSRDFLLEFESTQAAQQAAELLSSLRVEPGQQRLFGTVDNRGTSLFCMLTYPHPVDVGHLVTGEEFCTALAPEVALVALKNGMHRSEGSAFLSPGIEALAPAPMSHVSALHRTICSFFGVSPCKAARQAPWAVAVPGSAPGAAAAVPARSRHTLEQATKRAPV